MSNTLDIVSIIGAVQSILFALLIVVKKKRALPDWLLLLWFLVFCVHLLLGVGEKLAPTHVIQILIMTISFLHGPFFLLYTKAIFNQPFKKLDLLHFLPFILFFSCSFFIKQPSAMRWEITILITKLTSLIAYPLYILYVYNRRISSLKSNSADNRMLPLSWIRIIALLFLISMGITMIRLGTELMVGVAYFEIFDVLRYVVFVTLIGFYGLKYGMVYQPEVSFDLTAAEKKYKHSPLKGEEIQVLIDRISRFFEENDTYLSPDFSLAILSEAVDLPKHHLSQVINAEMETTFYDLVNSERVEYAMKSIREGKLPHLTLEGLGYECGFNSKSAFFHHFKKHTGKTPGKFKKEISTD